MKIKTTTIIRWLIGTGLLCLVWLNAHWSVALCLTLVGLRAEIIDISLELRKKVTDARNEIDKEI